MAVSHQRQRIIDLTTEPDKHNDEAALLPCHVTSTRTPSHGSNDGSQPAQPPLDGSQPVAATSLTRTIGSLDRANSGHGDFMHSERSTKRMRISEPESHPASPFLQPQPQPSITPAGTCGRIAATPANDPRRTAGNARSQERPGPARTAYSGSTQANISNKAPSVRDINQALKSNSTRIPLLDQVTTHTPRALQIGRISQTAGSASRVYAEPLKAQDTSHSMPQTCAQPPGIVSSHKDSTPRAPKISLPASTLPAETEGILNPSSAHLRSAMPSIFSRPNETPKYGNVGLLGETRDSEEPQSLERLILSEPSTGTTAPPSVPCLPIAAPPGPNPQTLQRARVTNQFTEEHDHFLIYLKEVKAYQWKKITEEFNKVFPLRAYHTLQSRYSTVLNKRNRAQDPVMLSLPMQFASEAAIDWATVHEANPGPRDPTETRGLPEPVITAKPKTRRHIPRDESFQRTVPLRQATDPEYSSGGDSVPRRERYGRAARVNYRWPRQRRRGEDMEMGEEGNENYTIPDYESEEPVTPTENDEASLGATVRFDTTPVVVEFEDADAKLTSMVANRSHKHSPKILPYLSVTELAAIKTIALEQAHDPRHRKSLQSCVWHVDFSSDEISVVEDAISRIKAMRFGSRHGTRRRQLRESLKEFSEAALLQLSNELCRKLRSRDQKSIEAFLCDAKAGAIADHPRIQRLAASRPDDQRSSRQSKSTLSTIRDREMGRQCTRGWRAASKSLTYQDKNRVMDTFGAATSWTGASGDIHAVAWAPSGETFAAAAVAVDDPDSMQYNRPNNLLFGKCCSNTIHELGQHYRKREKTAQGPNSTHAMFASQDPKIYNTVSSIGFSNSGRLLYSAGYDGSVCVWHTDTEYQQPMLGAMVTVKAPVEMIAINPVHTGMLAAAVKVSDNKAIRFLQFNEDDPCQFTFDNLHSQKAVARPDLKVLPTAIQFEPRYGGTLLAGFGANLRDFGFDTTGDIGLWDVKTLQALSIYGASLNVFDVEFNPNRSVMPLFAVGCVAGNNVNRGTKSIVRLYDERADQRYSFAREIECKALDINDVVWCPHDEYLIAAGCTDGQAYVWDVRYEMDPLHVLSHGQSVMPLQDGVKLEYTDTGVRFLSWGDNATRLYSGSSDGKVKVWDITRSKEDAFIKDIVSTNSGIMAGAFSPDRSKLVVGEVDGSVDVLEVGRDGYSLADALKLRYIPYEDNDGLDGDDVRIDIGPNSGVAEGQHLLNSGQLQKIPMGDLPMCQVVQGPSYSGPYDQSEEAQMLREKALVFQRSLATIPGSQCDIPACGESINKTTNEDVGDSGRSLDRIPDALSRAWASPELTHIVPGKSKCTRCGRPARPSWDKDHGDSIVLCEHCCFACFRCGSANAIRPGLRSLSCDSCAATWEIGLLGYEIIQPTQSAKLVLDVPPLRNFGKAMYLDRLEDLETSFGDEMNALSDYYFSLALGRPESPPL
ncbi:hypothetical protein NX059_001481 [Plenodomus lindquistii]|nr:hypothetical protein NX059_001481 [Plenodomus lindquistii]